MTCGAQPYDHRQINQTATRVATIPGRGRSNTKLLGALLELRPGRSRLHQFVQLLGSLHRIRAGRKPETCGHGAFGRESRIAHVRVLDRVHAHGADIRRVGRPALTPQVDRPGRGLLELRHRPVGICRRLPHPVRRTRHRRGRRSRLRDDRAEFTVGLLSRASARTRHGHFLLCNSGGFCAGLCGRRAGRQALWLARGILRRRHSRTAAGGTVSTAARSAARRTGRRDRACR